MAAKYDHAIVEELRYLNDRAANAVARALVEAATALMLQGESGESLHKLIDIAVEEIAQLERPA